MTFNEFYVQHYLPRHADTRCLVMHAIGPFVSTAYAVAVIWFQSWWLLILAPLPTSLLAWLGHWMVRNQPTFFEHPLWSVWAFWKMLATVASGKNPWAQAANR